MTTPTIPSTDRMKTLADEIMQSYPEYSFCVTCIKYDYDNGAYRFLDPETGREYVVTTDMVALALPIVRQLLADKKLFLDGLHSGEEAFFEAGNWDSIATDAAVQVAIFGSVIYG